jgi:hypothetical protein
MNQIKTGGPAFPFVLPDIGDGLTRHEEGMTLRDYFAAKAMQCMGQLMTKPYSNLDSTAETAYKMADAMLKARNK